VVTEPGMCGSFLYGNREIPRPAGSARSACCSGPHRESVEKSITDTERAISNLTTLCVYEHISHEEFLTERQKLEKELVRFKQQSEENTDDAFEPLRVLVSFRNRALECFRTGDTRTKRLVLSSVGSNLSLKDRALSIQANKPPRQIGNLYNPTQLRRAVNDIRKLYALRDPEFMAMLDNVRGLNARLENQSSAW